MPNSKFILTLTDKSLLLSAVESVPVVVLCTDDTTPIKVHRTLFPVAVLHVDCTPVYNKIHLSSNCPTEASE